MNNSPLQVGLDISQKRLDMCVMQPNGAVLMNHRSFANNRHGYEELKHVLLEQITAGGFTGVDIGAESTGYYWLPLFLQLQADESWGSHEPTLYLLNSRQVYWFKKGYAPDDKTDAKDSFYVTEKLRTQRGKYHPWSADGDWLRLRFYSRLRYHIGQALTREKNYFWSHMFLKCSDYRANCPFGDGLGATGRALIRQYPDWQCLTQLPNDILQDQLADWSHNRLPNLEETMRQLRQTVDTSYPLPTELQMGVQSLLCMTLDHIAFLEKQAAQVERCLEQEIDAYHPEVSHLVNIKGLGVVLAAGIAAEIGDLHRFFAGQEWDERQNRFRPKNLRDVEDAVAKHAGLWWPRKSSGDFEGDERRLSKKGNRFLRYYLVEAADKLRQYQPEYQAYYERKYRETKKHQHKRALVLTARKSIGLFVGLLHRNEPYRPQEARR